MMCRSALVLAAFGLVASAVMASGARAQATDTFVIADALAPSEVEETTMVYIDHHLAGSFHLDAGNRAGSFTVAVPQAERHLYALCGRAVTRDPDGRTAVHPVNDSGEIFDANGRTYEAYTAGYTAFFLVDVSEGRAPARIAIHLGGRCSAAVAMGGQGRPVLAER
jgi:hypothetical protein